MKRRSNKVGRNDTCPCGSGRKYKRCCLQAKRAPKASPRVDVDMLRDAIERLQGLLEPGGPLAALRFDAVAFDTAMEQHFDTALERYRAQAGAADAEAPWERLMEGCLPVLCTAAWTQRATAALQGLLETDLEVRDKLAVGLALAWEQTVATEGRYRGPSPLGMALFPIQLHEHNEQARALDDALHEAAAGLTIDDVRASLASVDKGEWGAVAGVAKVLENPANREAARRMVEVACERAMRAVRSNDPPALLTFDQQLRALGLFVRYRQGPNADPSGALDNEQLHAWFASDGLIDIVRDQCASNGMSASTKEKRALWADLSTAVHVDPAVLLIAALQNPALAWRSDEERALVTSIRQESEGMDPQTWAPWLQWLRDRGESEVADRATADLQALTDAMRSGARADTASPV